MTRGEIRRIGAHDTLVLRHEILRPHQAPEELVYPGDLDQASLHVGAFVDGSLVGVASVLPRPMPDGPPGPAWQLRGMAVRPEFRGRGFGRGMLRACIDYVATGGGGTMWCNARTPALSLYRAAGFETRGDEFGIPHAGPHYVMWLRVEPPGGGGDSADPRRMP
jgi:ribosomal protein S18 acetylase RimI-like enzyme